jgi:hypothetical protein
MKKDKDFIFGSPLLSGFVWGCILIFVLFLIVAVLAVVQGY